MVPVHERKERRLLPIEKLFNDNGVSRLPERAAHQHRVRRLARLLHGARDHHSLPGRQPVRLDHDRRSHQPDVLLRGRGVRELPVRRRGHLVPRAEVLHVAFGAFQPRRGLAGAEGGNPRGRQGIGQAVHEGRLGPDDHEPDAFLLAEGGDGGVVGEGERGGGDAGLAGDAGVAGGTVEIAACRALAQAPAEGVLAPAACHWA